MLTVIKTTWCEIYISTNPLSISLICFVDIKLYYCKRAKQELSFARRCIWSHVWSCSVQEDSYEGYRMQVRRIILDFYLCFFSGQTDLFAIFPEFQKYEWALRNTYFNSFRNMNRYTYTLFTNLSWEFIVLMSRT